MTEKGNHAAIEKAARPIDQADALIVAAGAGMGAMAAPHAVIEIQG